MMNSTQVSYFILTAYFDTEVLRYLYFMVVFFIYILIVGSNLFLILVICLNKSLHEPMYIFLCSLFVNELYGSTGLFPFLLVQILSDIHTISVPFCFLQIFLIFTYGNIELCNLAVMSYDRYLSICDPLRYTTRMTFKKVAMLLALVWLFPFIEVSVMISLSVTLQLCGNIINKVYCDNFSVVKLACFDTTVNNIYGIIYTLTIVICVITVIIYTYIEILKVCFSGSKETREKALSTCTPHLASILNFCFGIFFEIFQSRFDMSSVVNMSRIFLSLYFLTCPPLFNPLMYGLKLSKIYSLCKRLVFGQM